MLHRYWTLVLVALSTGVLQSAGLRKDAETDPSKRRWVETVSWQPRAQVYHNFLTPEECDHIVKVARPMMRRSTVVGAGGKSVEDHVRTSRGTFLRRNKDEVIGRVERRLELVTHHNMSHQEDMQILRYSDRQKYGAHMDVLVEDTPRAATVLLYLTDVEEGGETAFPSDSKWANPKQEKHHGPFSECAMGHVAVKPKKGQALIFYSLTPGSKSQDPHSMHTGCPVIRGVKWTATVWIHTAPFRPENLENEVQDDKIQMPEDCEDLNKKCGEWVAAGECKNNAPYMIGEEANFGNCRKSCQACEDCALTDLECRARNRVKAGFPSLDELS